jgi:hypothetical protein
LLEAAVLWLEQEVLEDLDLHLVFLLLLALLLQ